MAVFERRKKVAPSGLSVVGQDWVDSGRYKFMNHPINTQPCPIDGQPDHRCSGGRAHGPQQQQADTRRRGGTDDQAARTDGAATG